MVNAQCGSLNHQHDIICAIKFLINHRECSVRSTFVTSNISITGTFTGLQDCITFRKTSKYCIKNDLKLIQNLRLKFGNGSKYSELIFWGRNEGDLIHKEIALVFCGGFIKKPKHGDKYEYSGRDAADVLAVRSIKKRYIPSETYHTEDAKQLMSILASNKSHWAGNVNKLSDAINIEDIKQTTQMAINQDVEIWQENTLCDPDSCLTISSTCQLAPRMDKAGERFQRNDNKPNFNYRLHVKKTNHTWDKRPLKPVISVSSTEFYKQYNYSENVMQGVTCKKSTSRDSFFYCKEDSRKNSCRDSRTDSRKKVNNARSATLKITIETLSDTINRMTFKEQTYSKIFRKPYNPINDKGDYNFDLGKKRIKKENKHHIDALMRRHLSSSDQKNISITVYGLWDTKSASPLPGRMGNVANVKPNDDQDMGTILAKKQTNKFRPISDHGQKENLRTANMLPDTPIRSNKDRLKKKIIVPTFDINVEFNKAEKVRITEKSQESVGFRPFSHSDVEIASIRLNPKNDVIPYFVNQTRLVADERGNVRNISTTHETDNDEVIEHIADFNSTLQEEHDCKDEDKSIEDEHEPVIDTSEYNYRSCDSFVPGGWSTHELRHLGPPYPYSDTGINKMKNNENNSTEKNEMGKHSHAQNSNHKDLVTNDQKSGANADNASQGNNVLFEPSVKEAHADMLNEKTSKRTASLLKFDVLTSSGKPKIQQKLTTITIKKQYNLQPSSSKGFIPLLENELGTNDKHPTIREAEEKTESSTKTVQKIQPLSPTKLQNFSKERSNMGDNLTKPDQVNLPDIEKLSTPKTEYMSQQFATQERTFNKVDHDVSKDKKIIEKTGNPELKPLDKKEYLKRATPVNQFEGLQKKSDVCLSKYQYLKLRQPVVKEPRIKHTGMRPAVIWEKHKDLTLDQLRFLEKKRKTPVSKKTYPKLQEPVHTTKEAKRGQAESSKIHPKNGEKQTPLKTGDCKHKALEREVRPRYKIHQCSLYTTEQKPNAIQKKTKKIPVQKIIQNANTRIANTTTGRTVKTSKQIKVTAHDRDITKAKRPQVNDKWKDPKEFAENLHDNSFIIGGNRRYKKHQCVFPSSNETSDKVKTSKQPVNAKQSRIIKNITDRKQTKQSQPKEKVEEQLRTKQIAFSNQVNLITDNRNNLDTRLCSDRCMDEVTQQLKLDCSVEESSKESDKNHDEDPLSPIPCTAKLEGAIGEENFHCHDVVGPVDFASVDDTLTSIEQFKKVDTSIGESFGSREQLDAVCGDMCEESPAYQIETKPGHAEIDVKVNICPDEGGTNIEDFKEECVLVSSRKSLDLLNDGKIQNQLGSHSEANGEQINSEMVSNGELLCNRLELDEVTQKLKLDCPVEESSKESDKNSDKDSLSPIPCPAKLEGASGEESFRCLNQLGPVDCASVDECFTSTEQFKEVGGASEKSVGPVEQPAIVCDDKTEESPAYQIETKPGHDEIDVKVNTCTDGDTHTDVLKEECVLVSSRFSDLLNDGQIQNQLGYASEDNVEQIHSETVGKTELLCNRSELETVDNLAGTHLPTTNGIIRNEDKNSILSDVEVLEEKDILEQPNKSHAIGSTLHSGNTQTEGDHRSLGVVGYTTSQVSRRTCSVIHACCGVIQAARATPQVGLLLATNMISSTVAWGFLKDNYRLRNTDVL